MKLHKNRFRPTVELLEGRDLPSATLLEVANAITHSYENHARYVQDAYHHLLHREPSRAEVNSWAVHLDQGWHIEQIEAGFIASAEYRSNHGGTGTAWVRAMYQELL